MLLVRAHHHLGELGDALRVAEGYADKHPEDAEVSGQLAMLYFDADDLTKARAWADKAIALPRKTPEAYSTAGFLALGDEDEKRAQELLGRALELNPRSGRAWVGKGMALMFGGEFASAEEALARAVEHMPQHIGTWHALGGCRIMRGDLDGAAQEESRALEQLRQGAREMAQQMLNQMPSRFGLNDNNGELDPLGRPPQRTDGPDPGMGDDRASNP